MQLFLKGIMLACVVFVFAGTATLAQAQTTPTPQAEKIPDECRNFYDLFWVNTDRPGVPKSNLVDGLPKICTATQLLTRAINILLGFAGGVAVLFVMIGGFWYLTAAGNEEQAEKGQKALTMAVIGLAIIIMAFVIVRVAVNVLTLGSLGGGVTAPSTPGTETPAGGGTPAGTNPENNSARVNNDIDSIYYIITVGDFKDYSETTIDYLKDSTTYTANFQGRGAIFKVEIAPNNKMAIAQLRYMCGESDPVMEAYIEDEPIGTSGFSRPPGINAKWVATVGTEQQLNNGDELSIKICGKKVTKTFTFTKVAPR